MALIPGTRLGPYEILSASGAGGMGEVYKARDTRLDRTVAVKVLPTDLAADPDRRARFEREARAIAALSHPHICTIHDVGRHEDIDYLVMEYLEGETLTERLAHAKGPLPLGQVLTIGIDIADALDKAHRAGITHRDVKPANIFLVRRGGTSAPDATLLDFGLAKLRGPAAPITMSAMTMATATPATATGTILGTIHYMAPEQVEGREADTRSDIWALGAVLYEMATGTRPFDGASAASVIGAILKDTPPAVSTRQPLTPPALDHLVERCLEKDADDRWQDARDLTRELKWITAGGTAVAPVGARTRNPWLERAAWLVSAGVLLGLALYFATFRGPAPSTGDVVRFPVYSPEKTVFSGVATVTVATPQFALSPDGRALVFASVAAGAKPILWLRILEDVAARPLPGTENGEYPFWSADSGWVGFFAEGKLKKIRATGGPVQVVTEDVPDPRGGSWGATDIILIGTGTSSIYRVASGGGTATPVTKLDDSGKEGSHRWPHFLPDGRHFLFTIRSELGDRRGVYAGSLDGEMKKFLVRPDSNALYVSGYLLFLEGDTLLGQTFDAERLEIRGQSFLVAGRVGRSTTGYGAVSASRSGTLVYGGTNLPSGRLTWFDRSGTPFDSVGPEGDYTDFRLSPDEKRLAASLVDPTTGNPDIWLTELLRGSPSRFTFGPGLNSGPVWSPDGARLVFRTTRRGGQVEFYGKSSAGGGNEEPVLPANVQRAAGGQSLNLSTPDWSPDGQNLLYSVTASSGSELWLLPVSERKPVRLLRVSSVVAHASFSPDGRFITYASDESGKLEVYVQTFPLSDRKWKVSTSGGYQPRWRRDGLEIYYLSPDRKLMAASVGPGPSFDAPKPLFQTNVPVSVTGLRTHYVPSRDGRRFLINTQSAEPVPVPITVVLNWTAGLKK